MAHLRITGSEVFAGSVDVLIMVIEGGKDTVQAFSGFLETLDGDLKHFEPLVSIIYRGTKAKGILASSTPDEKSEDQEIRTVPVDDSIRRLIVDWLFRCQETEVIE